MSAETPTATVQARHHWLPWLLVCLFVFQVLTPSRVWIALLCALGGGLGLAYGWARLMARQIHLTREQRYGWVHVGDLLEERFELRNDSFLPLVWIEINDQSDLPGYSARTVRSAAGQDTVRWRSEGTCRQRGLFRLGPWQAHMSDPFGFFEVTLSFAQTQSILVYPPVVRLPELLLPAGAAAGVGHTSRRTAEVTTNAGGVRSYAPGDSLSHVHWRSTARLEALMVKTFDREPSGDLWIVLDLDSAVQAGEGEESTEEYGVILAASLAGSMLDRNRAVGLVAYGTVDARSSNGAAPRPVIVLPQKGRAHQMQILEALATVRAGSRWPLARVLAEMDRNLGRGMTMAVITPSCDPAWLEGLLLPMRRGVAPATILLDPGSFGGEGNVEGLAGLLAELGVPCHRIAKGMPFEPLVRHRRLGRAEFRVLPGTGRVIAVDR